MIIIAMTDTLNQPQLGVVDHGAVVDAIIGVGLADGREVASALCPRVRGTFGPRGPQQKGETDCGLSSNIRTDGYTLY